MKVSKEKSRPSGARPRVSPRPLITVADVVGTASDSAPICNVDPKWVRHYRALVALRRRLIDDRAEEIAEATNSLETHGMSLADSAKDEFDHDLLLAALSANQDRLFEVVEAIRRIENHTYGICELTGHDIPGKRLRAVPWTRFTKEAEEHLERQNAVGMPRLGQRGSVRSPCRPQPPLAEPSTEILEWTSARPPKRKSLVSECNESAASTEAQTRNRQDP